MPVYSYRYIINISSTTDYCPMDSAYCSISVAYDYHYSHYTARIEDHETTVTCYRDTQLKSFARYVFKYSTIIMSALIIVLIFTDTGHVSVMDVFIDVPFFSLCEAHSSHAHSLFSSFRILHDTHFHAASHVSTDVTSRKDLTGRSNSNVSTSFDGVKG